MAALPELTEFIDWPVRYREAIYRETLRVARQTYRRSADRPLVIVYTQFEP